jgi:hypothetical protein
MIKLWTAMQLGVISPANRLVTRPFGTPHLEDAPDANGNVPEHNPVLFDFRDGDSFLKDEVGCALLGRQLGASTSGKLRKQTIP